MSINCYSAALVLIVLGYICIYICIYIICTHVGQHVIMLYALLVIANCCTLTGFDAHQFSIATNCWRLMLPQQTTHTYIYTHAHTNAFSSWICANSCNCCRCRCCCYCRCRHIISAISRPDQFSHLCRCRQFDQSAKTTRIAF